VHDGIDGVSRPRRSPDSGLGASGGFAGGLCAFGDRPAIVAQDGATISYVDLAARADAFAARLGPARRLVTIEAANEIEPLVAYLGALRHGHPAMLLGPGQAATSRVAQAYRPDVVFAKADGGWRAVVAAEPAGGLHPELALLLSTSGSTGTPKFVRLSRTAVAANAAAIGDYLALDAGDRPVLNLPLHYSYGHSIVGSTLARGGCLLMTDASVIEPGFWDFARAQGATMLAGVPYTFDLFERVGFRDMVLPALRRVTQAGGRLDPEVARRYAAWARERDVDFYLMYGQTEATARMAYLEPALAAEHPDAIGGPIPGGQFRLLDAEGDEVTEAGVEGELVYAGPNVMMGYAQGRDDLAGGPELAELRTGDLARRDDQGLYRITGRLSRIIKPFGVRVSLDEVERLLASPGRRVIAAGDDELLAVALVGDDPAAAPVEAARRLIEAQLGLPAANFDVSARAEPPLLPSGKIDYGAVTAEARRRQDLARQAARAERRGSPVAQAFHRAFPAAAITADDSFISLAGDSLSYVALTLDLEAALGPLPERWETRTVGELEQAASARTPARARWWSFVSLDTEAAVRAAAILAVVANHSALMAIAGGANVLLVLAGLNIARNNYDRLISGKSLSIILPFTLRIILPYYVIMLAFMLYRGAFDLGSLFLVGNWLGRTQYLNSYWFLEFLFQTMIFIAVAFTIPAVRRWARQGPWTFGLWVLGISLAIRLGAAATLPEYVAPTVDRAEYSLFYLVALGWLIRFADTRARKLLLTAVAMTLGVLDATGLFGLWFQDSYPRSLTHAALLCAGAALLIWTRSIPVPKILRGLFATISRLGYYIYITLAITLHGLVTAPGYRPILGLVAGVGVGVLAGEALQMFERQVGPRFRRRPSQAIA
jgi:acyl-CoA synthetase (AMP-forming)/AMP-acid ligase II